MLSLCSCRGGTLNKDKVMFQYSTVSAIEIIYGAIIINSSSVPDIYIGPQVEIKVGGEILDCSANPYKCHCFFSSSS